MEQQTVADINDLGQMVGSLFDVDVNGNPIQRSFLRTRRARC